jgi:tetratricopeptide (TPR) repeat protein
MATATPLTGSACTLLLLCSASLLACGGGDGEGSSPAQGEPSGSVSVAADLPEGAQAWSLLGEALFPPEFPEEAVSRMGNQLTEALASLDADPSDPDAMIWVGRRTAYLGEYRRAIELFGLGAQAHPDDARFPRHSGHRYISVRELDNAITEFSRAAELIQGREDEVEPDGQPNALGIPTSTLHFNIWYHYGLAHYLKGEFDQAIDKYRMCMEASEHPDSKVATAHWLYMSFRRMGMDEEAEDFIRSLDLDALAPDVIESGSYLELLRLYQSDSGGEMGVESPEDMYGAALGYGYGNWLLYNGRVEEARAVFEQMVAARNQWASFGYIAAEAELARMAPQ